MVNGETVFFRLNLKIEHTHAATFSSPSTSKTFKSVLDIWTDSQAETSSTDGE